ncbi:MAG: hypothetical protein LEGION0403_FIIPPAGN_02925 [Legionella sp.]
MNKRIKYSKEFKLDAISLVNEQGYTRKAAAESLGVDYQLLCRWLKEASNQEEGQAFRGQGKLTAEQEEIRRLKEENKRLKLEKEILKKAALFFAQETK